MLKLLKIFNNYHVADSSEDDDEGSDEEDKEKSPVDGDGYFEAAPAIQTTDISFTDMNLSRPLLKVSARTLEPLLKDTLELTKPPY